VARFFIDRPIFAMVIAIVTVILGLAAIPTLPVATYPEVVPPVVQITAVYRGGNSQDLEKTVAQPIEQQLVGLDGMLYFFSSSSNDGLFTISVTFELGTDVDQATVETQNKVNVALPLLPAEVQRQGVLVRKVSSQFLMAIPVFSTDSRYDSVFLNNFATINLVDQLGSIPGVGEARLVANQDYGMRIWVDPDKMATLGVTAADVSNAIQTQNRQNAAGSLGQPPSPSGTDFQYPVNATGRLVESSEFADIVVRARPDGSLLRVRDLGRVELGAQDYRNFSHFNKQPAAVVIVFLTPGANAVETAERVRTLFTQAKANFPAGIDYEISYDSTMFVSAAIEEVIFTLLEALALVIFVVFLFLQSWRATLIPLVTVPVSILGTFAVFPFLGFSINMTSLFGLVLAIGIVVDDAIVVVEAVQHNIDHGLSPRDATVKAMSEVSGPVIAIAFILAAVFIPVAFLGGISGQIYRQFALTIAVSVLISAFSALSLSPALSALLLRPADAAKGEGALARAFGLFNRAFERATNGYLSGVRVLLRRSILALTALAALFLAAGGLFKILPAGFLPAEDQGVLFAAVRLPDGASLERNIIVTEQVEAIIESTPGVADTTTFGGFDFITRTNNSNVATVIGTLEPWADRTSEDLQFDAIVAKLQQRLNGVEGAVSFAFGLPPILGLGSAGGFEFMLEDRSGGSVDELAAVTANLLAAASKRPELGLVQTSLRTTVPQYKVEVNTEKVQTMSIPLTDVYDALQTFLGGLYVNDFNRFGRTWRVLMQAEPSFRDSPEDIGRFYVRTSQDDMAPLSTLSTVESISGPEVVYRYNRFRTAKILGQAAPGYSSGQASAAMEEIAAESLPSGYSYEWTGTVYEEKLAAGKEGFIFGAAAVLVFLFLAALYESWSIPFAVVLVVPLGLFGALSAIYLRSYPYDIYTQIGIITLIGLSAKNAILIVEFAKLRREEGESIVDAAVDAAKLRLRPILMTSFAFILGVTPLVVASGAGGAARRALGTTVFGGMLAATLLAVFIVPVLYVVIQSFSERRRRSAELSGTPEPASGAGQ
jgi:hydrophobe/amphiphile efflux-1 (HAE1) family protein